MDRNKIKYLLTAALFLLFAPLVSGLPVAQGLATQAPAQDTLSAETVTPSAAPTTATHTRRERREKLHNQRAKGAHPDAELTPPPDSLSDSLHIDSLPDSLRATIARDTTVVDTTRRKKSGGGGDMLQDIISGKNKDSLVFKPLDKMVYIYNQGDVSYQTSNLKADYMRINMNTKEIYAYGKADSLEGKPITTHPIFEDNGDAYTMDTINYNMNSKKAKIKGVATQQGDGWLIGGNIKKMHDNTVNIKDGKYTTCEHTDHPHFYLEMPKAKMIPGKKVVTGPAYIVMEDVPLYFLGIPEGFFPINSGPKSGILMPSYGEEYTKGFFIRDLGYYFTLGEHADLAIRGGIYTLGSWEASVASSYIKRYKYTGNIDAKYSSIRAGEKGEPDFLQSNAFHLGWIHSQAPTANPGSTFSASVNFSTSGYSKYSSNNLNDILSTQTNSTISYSKNWAGTPFSLSARMAISQNSSTKKVEITFPDITFTVARFKPFKRKEAIGKERWYEKIFMSYNGAMTNSVSADESDVFSEKTLKNMKNGISHKIPISASFNVFNYINITPAFNYDEKWYFKKVEQQYNPVTNRAETLDPEYGFWRLYNYDAQIQATTTIYGNYNTKKKNRKLQAVRHTLTPTIGFAYNPDFNALKYGYYKTVQTDSLGGHKVYSPFSDNAYGVPSTSEAARLTFSLRQTLEMKVLSKRDTSGVKKLKLIDELSIGGSYNLIADSMKLSTINISLRSTIFKNFGIQLSAVLDPYEITPDGRRYNKLMIRRGLPGRIMSTGWNFGYTFKSRDDKSAPAINDQTSIDPLYQNPFYDPYGQMEPVLRRQYMSQAYYDFSLPWNLSFTYDIRYSALLGNYPPKGYKAQVTQSITLNGSLNITPKTGIVFQGGFDITKRELTTPCVTITRDLHCWQMSFVWFPIGEHKSWSFNIGVRAPSLADLKYDKSQSMFDNMY
ncbi:MAG: putative LPS assembly protein LptD [Alistipes sp.]